MDSVYQRRKARAGPAEFIREQHRRLIGILRRIDMTGDRLERIELASTLSEEIREFIALECEVLQPALDDAVPEQFSIAGAAHRRRGDLVALAARLDVAASRDEDPGQIVNRIFSTMVVHIGAAVREIMPCIERFPAASSELLEARLRDLKEKMAEH